MCLESIRIQCVSNKNRIGSPPSCPEFVNNLYIFVWSAKKGGFTIKNLH